MRFTPAGIAEDVQIWLAQVAQQVEHLVSSVVDLRCVARWCPDRSAGLASVVLFLVGRPRIIECGDVDCIFEGAVGVYALQHRFRRQVSLALACEVQISTLDVLSNLGQALHEIHKRQPASIRGSRRSPHSMP